MRNGLKQRPFFYGRPAGAAKVPSVPEVYADINRVWAYSLIIFFIFKVK